jgi:Protein of unknown function (DUF3592)
MVVPILISTGLAVCGIVLLYIGYRLRCHFKSFLESSIEAPGTVVCMDEKSGAFGSGRSYAYGMLVSYKDDQGGLHTVRNNRLSFPEPCEAGTARPVFYQATNPQNAMLGPRNEVFRPSNACFVAGILLLIIGASLFRFLILCHEK